MASFACCLFCFESLAARLDNRPLRLSLSQVQELWTQYIESTADESKETEVAEEEDGEEKAPTTVGSEPEIEESPQPPVRASRRIGFGQLLSLSPSSRSQSSTPSSVGSSNVTRAPSEVPSKSSSRSSFFTSPATNAPGRSEGLIEAQEYPLFVTWNTLGRLGHKSLRGCIGTFEKQQLEDGLRSYALTAALEDTRFTPITKRELSSLEVGVTLLTDFETCETPMSWELGLHGLRISFSHHSKRYGATYLPDVAVEQGWSKEEALVSLMRKAGWSGRKDEWRRMSDLKVVRYQGKKAALAYSQWQEWRAWLEKQGSI